MAESKKPKKPAAKKPEAKGNKSAAKKPPKTSPKAPIDPDDDDILRMGMNAGEDEGDEDESDMNPDDRDGVSTGGNSAGRQRASAELAAALMRKTNNSPAFPFPPELDPRWKPYWTEVVNSRPLNYFNQGDVTLLKLYCRAAYDMDRLTKEIDSEGDVIRNAKGNPVVNPKVLVRSIAEARLLSLSAKLRLQPAARYDSGNDKKNAQKKQKADEAADHIDDDQDGLLAGGTRH